jgi:sugar lactone lactonase YvrE
MSRRRNLEVIWRFTLAFLVCATLAWAQTGGKPVNDRPNPYTTLKSWLSLPAARVLGAVGAIDIDADGRSVWIADRCGGVSCVDSAIAPIMKIAPDGTLVQSFGAGLFAVPHGIHVDREGNVWMTDDATAPSPGKGHQVLKFAPDGTLLMRLGHPGVAGAGEGEFNRPTDVVVAPNGDIFVADGHGGDSNARIVKFSKSGRFIKTWGRRGSAPGEFDTPHSLAMDSQGRLFVADLRNFRIQIFDQEGTFLDQWTQFGMPGGLFINRNDVLYVADSLSSADTHPGWVRGIRIGSARDGRVTAFIPDPTPNATPITAAEGVAADALGNVFGAIVPAPGIQKHVLR